MVKASALSSFGIHLDNMINRAGLNGPETAPIVARIIDMADAPKYAVMGTAQRRRPIPNKLADSVLWPPIACAKKPPGIIEKV